MFKDTKRASKDQSGQTLVEFILLLAGIVMISYAFMNQINTNISSRWQRIATLILSDQNQALNIR